MSRSSALQCSSRVVSQAIRSQGEASVRALHAEQAQLRSIWAQSEEHSAGVGARTLLLQGVRKELAKEATLLKEILQVVPNALRVCLFLQDERRHAIALFDAPISAENAVMAFKNEDAGSSLAQSIHLLSSAVEEAATGSTTLSAPLLRVAQKRARKYALKVKANSFLSTMSPRSRYQQVAVSHLYDVEEMFERGSRCRHCWLPMVSCICSVASAGVDGVGTGACSFKVLVQSHYQEYGRGSSTGILLPLAMGGEYASLHVPGDGTAAEKDWLRCVNEVPHESLLLFPGPTALPASELAPAPPGGWNVLVVDGTWTQAKKLARAIPSSIQRVTLGGVGALPVKSPMRSQATDTRVCTITAFMQLALEMGCSDSYLDSLWRALWCKARAVCQRSGKEWKSDKGGTSGGGALSADSGWSQMAAAHRAAAKQGATGPEVLQIAQQMAELLDGEEDASE